MTVPVQTPYNNYVGNAATTAFSYTFLVLLASDLVVKVSGVTLVNGVGYTVTGIGSVSGGTVTMTSAPASLAPITIYRSTSITRAVDYQSNGDFLSPTVNGDFDRLWLVLQELFSGPSGFGRMVKAPVGETIGDLPAASVRAGNLLSFDSNGNPLAVAAVAGSATQLAIDLASTALSTKNAGQIGFNSALAYAAGTVGGALALLSNGLTVIVGDGVTDKSAALLAANALGKPLLIYGVLVIGTPTTITVPIVDTMSKIFTTTSQITINNGQPVRPEWWGPVAGLGGNVNGMIRYAVNALPSNGGTVKLVNAAYRSGYDTATPTMFNARGGTPGLDYMVRQHISIVGEKLGEYNGTLTQMQNGTIIQGTFYISSECTGLRVDLISVDAGPAVVTALYAGVAAGVDGFCVLQCNKATPAYGTDIHLGTINALGSGTGTLSHAFLLEAISGDLKYAEGVNAWHGVVLKTTDFYAGTLVGKGCFSEDVIFKSDAYAVLGVLSVDQVISKGTTSGSVAGDFGLMIQAATAAGGGITIGNLTVDNKNFGLRLTGTGALILADINIGSVTIRGCTYAYDIVNDVKRSQIASMKINAATAGGVTIYPGVVEGSHYIGSLSMANVAVGITNGSSTGGAVRVGSIFIDGVAGNLYSYSNASATLMVEGAVSKRGTNGVLSNITPALAGTWVNQGGVFEPFDIFLKGGNVVLQGVIKLGGAGTILTVPVNWRPVADVLVPVIAFASAGSVYKSIQLSISAATGVVSIVDLAATTGGTLSLHGAAWAIPF